MKNFKKKEHKKISVSLRICCEKMSQQILRVNVSQQIHQCYRVRIFKNLYDFKIKKDIYQNKVSNMKIVFIFRFHIFIFG